MFSMYHSGHIKNNPSLISMCLQDKFGFSTRPVCKKLWAAGSVSMKVGVLYLARLPKADWRFFVVGIKVWRQLSPGGDHPADLDWPQTPLLGGWVGADGW